MREIRDTVPEDPGKRSIQTNRHSAWYWMGLIVIKYILPIAIVLLGGLFALHLYKTKPKSKRKNPAPQARLVEVVPVEQRDACVIIEAWGTVMPAREVELKPQVMGKIIEMNPKIIPGGFLREGQNLIRIEPDDYQLIFQQRQSDVANAESYLKLEQGNQAIAKQEYKLLDEEISQGDRELILRQPQLVSAQAALKAAQARRDQANLDCKRTEITAPFDAVVKDKYVDLGAMVSQGTPLVGLIGTDTFWAEVMVPEDELKWIQIPGRNGSTGSKVKIYNPSGWDEGVFREGQVLRLASELEEKGRRARLLISVRDPLALTDENAGKEPLLIGSYVRVEIEGETISSVVELDRQYLRDGDNVWILTPAGTLSIRPIQVVKRGEKTVLLRNGFDPNDLIITTDLATPVNGTQLRLDEEKSSPAKPDDRNGKKPIQRTGRSQ